MWVTSRYSKQTARRVAMSASLLGAAFFWGGCLMDGSASAEKSPAAQETEVGSKSLRDQTSSGSRADGVPEGCRLEWSSTAHDSVVFCPDIRPPKPQ